MNVRSGWITFSMFFFIYKKYTVSSTIDLPTNRLLYTCSILVPARIINMYLHAYNTTLLSNKINWNTAWIHIALTPTCFIAEGNGPIITPLLWCYITHDQVAGFARKHRRLLIQATQPSILFATGEMRNCWIKQVPTFKSLPFASPVSIRGMFMTPYEHIWDCILCLWFKEESLFEDGMTMATSKLRWCGFSLHCRCKTFIEVESTIILQKTCQFWSLLKIIWIPLLPLILLNPFIQLRNISVQVSPKKIFKVNILSNSRSKWKWSWSPHPIGGFLLLNLKGK